MKLRYFVLSFLAVIAMVSSSKAWSQQTDPQLVFIQETIEIPDSGTFGRWTLTEVLHISILVDLSNPGNSRIERFEFGSLWRNRAGEIMGFSPDTIRGDIDLSMVEQGRRESQLLGQAVDAVVFPITDNAFIGSREHEIATPWMLAVDLNNNQLVIEVPSHFFTHRTLGRKRYLRVPFQRRNGLVAPSRFNHSNFVPAQKSSFIMIDTNEGVGKKVLGLCSAFLKMVLD